MTSLSISYQLKNRYRVKIEEKRRKRDEELTKRLKDRNRIGKIQSNQRLQVRKSIGRRVNQNQRRLMQRMVKFQKAQTKNINDQSKKRLKSYQTNKVNLTKSIPKKRQIIKTIKALNQNEFQKDNWITKKIHSRIAYSFSHSSFKRRQIYQLTNLSSIMISLT